MFLELRHPRLVALVLLCCACGTSPGDAPPRAPEAIETFGSGPPLRYLILGDSTAVAEGGSYAHGIARETARYLARSHTVQLKNLAVSGARVTDVLHEQLPRAGTFVPDIVLLDVGPNDVVHLTSSASVESDLEGILTALAAKNCRMHIVLTGSADMSTPPRIPRPLRWLAARRTAALNRRFRRAAQRHHLVFAPIADVTGPLFRQDRSLFSADRFHPNDRGYATWIAVIAPALDEALATPPRLCAQ